MWVHVDTSSAAMADLPGHLAMSTGSLSQVTQQLGLSPPNGIDERVKVVGPSDDFGERSGIAAFRERRQAHGVSPTIRRKTRVKCD
jgi:hypothetical protein